MKFRFPKFMATIHIGQSNSARWPQYLAGFSSALGAFAFGSALGWSSPVSPKIQEDNEYFKLTSSQFDWIASIINLGCAVSCIPIGALMNVLGRKYTMLSLIIPFAIGWSLIVWAQNFTMMLIGRFVLGIAGGAFCIASPQYTSEIAEKEIRGTLGTFFQLFVILGILFAYVVGAFTNIFSLSVICGVLPLIFGIMFVFMPETPYYLIYKNKMESCEKSLWWLRGRHYDIQTEINEIKTEFERQQNERTSLREAFKKRATIKALIIAVGSLIFQQLSGINVVIFYAGDIFKAAKVQLSSSISSIILGTMHALATLLATLIVDKAGRKILLLISAIFMSICLLALGAFFYLSDSGSESVNELGWLPLTSLSIYILNFAIGFGPIPWVLVSEVFSNDVKPIGGSLTGVINWILAFMVTNTFGLLSHSIGTGPTFWLFAGMTALGILFVFFIVIETKGKSMTEIQSLLSGTNQVGNVENECKE